METKKTKRKKLKSVLVFIAVFSFFLTLSSHFTIGQPTGLEITGNVTETLLTVSPESRSDEGGTITTLVVDVLQQNPLWKAYVGNLTGTLTLDDASGQSIFRWFLGAEDMSGEVYISRSDSVTWGDATCNETDLQTAIDSEESALDFNSSSVDSINRTFNETTHPPFNIDTIALSGCRSTHTYVNSTSENQSEATFPIMLLTDTANLVYASPLNQGSQSFNNETFVDFQAIVPNKRGESTMYYFYAQITS